MSKYDVETIQNTLAQFSGSQRWYRHWVPAYRFTEGVHYLAEAAGAYWLLDIIVSHQVTPAVAREEFQSWHLKRAGAGCVVWATDGNNRELVRQEVEHTDFPMSDFVLFLTDHCILLPGEY